ncbi:MAG: oxepin-CoA hydrolase, alternative type [Burkholderiaceae bacterium]
MTAQLKVEHVDDVIVMTISNPQARNALSPEVYAAAIEVLDSAGKDVGALVLTGEGAHFCGGGNLNRLLANREKDIAVAAESVTALGNWVEALRTCEKPVIAAVEGACAGAGFALALACDMVVAASDAKFVMAYTKVGLSPDGGATWTLPRRLPPALAFEAAAFATPLTAQQLAQHGVVNRVVEPGRALEAAMEIAHQLAAGPRSAITRIKQLLDSAPQRTLAEHLKLEREQFLRTLFEADAKEGISAFLEKRAPNFKGKA